MQIKALTISISVARDYYISSGDLVTCLQDHENVRLRSAGVESGSLDPVAFKTSASLSGTSPLGPDSWTMGMDPSAFRVTSANDSAPAFQCVSISSVRSHRSTEAQTTWRH